MLGCRLWARGGQASDGSCIFWGRALWLPHGVHNVNSRRLPALGWISSLWHSEHWAEITLRQHGFPPSQCFVLIKQSDSPCPNQFRVWAFFVQQKRPKDFPLTVRPNANNPKVAVRFSRPKLQTKGLLHPLLRANPSSEGTDQFCRLPLSTLFQDQRLFTLGTWCGNRYGLLS